MLKKIFTITLLIIVIIEIQRVQCRPREPAARFGKVPPNCDQVDHVGNCVQTPNFMQNGISKLAVAPKRAKQMRETDDAETKKHWICNIPWLC